MHQTTKTFSIDELAKHIKAKVIGDGSTTIHSASTLETAKEGQISFLANRKYRKLLDQTKASAIIVSKEQETATPQIIAPNPYYAFREIVVHLHGHRRHPFEGINPTAVISPSANVDSSSRISNSVTISDNVIIGKNATIYPGVFIGANTEIGDDCILYPNAVIFENIQIGDRVIIQANASIGHDGFGFATHQGVHHKIPHIGKVILEDEVEIGANSSIERGAFDNTVIGEGSKIGDAVVVGHGSRIGKGCLLVPQVGIAGSVKLGSYCSIGGQGGVIGHTTIGDNVIIAAKSCATHDLKSNQAVMGFPAIEMNSARRSMVLFKDLPKHREQINQLEKRIQELEAKTES